MKALVLNALGRGFDFKDVDIAAPMGREVLVNAQDVNFGSTNFKRDIPMYAQLYVQLAE